MGIDDDNSTTCFSRAPTNAFLYDVKGGGNFHLCMADGNEPWIWKTKLGASSNIRSMLMRQQTHSINSNFMGRSLE